MNKRFMVSAALLRSYGTVIPVTKNQSPVLVFRVGPEELDDQALHDLGGAAEELLLLHLGVTPPDRLLHVGLALERQA